MSYKHLSLKERHHIELGCRKSTSQNEISKTLG
ncbi:MAG TPA: hypothetical protein EYQ43_05255 [Methyloprofundus sp.]|nr:hypothetical protein [Methyloprofundus sp.]HIL79123.1 hypothetical protein [Methylococcales bacterium]